MRDAVFTAWPQTSYEKRVSPLPPAVAGPQWMPTRSLSRWPPSGGWRSITSIIASASRPTATAPATARPSPPPAPPATAPPFNPPRRHIAVSDGLDLVDLVSLAEFIECADEPIKKVDDLLGGKIVGGGREAGEVREHHAEHVDLVCDAGFTARFQACRDCLWHERPKQGFGACMLVLQLHPGAIPVPQRVEDERGNDRRRIDHGLTRQHVAKRLVFRHDQPGDRREIEREHERNDIKTEQDEEQTPVLHSEEEQYGTAERVIDVKRAREAERPHDEH